MDAGFKDLLNEFGSKLGIDRFNLEIEACNQPILLEEVGSVKVDAKNQAKEAKDKLELIKSRLLLDIKRNPDKYNLEKPTEATVAAAIVCEPEYQSALKEFNILEEQSNAIDIIYAAVEQRKSLIREAVSLYVHEYYSKQPMKKEEEALEGVTQQDIIELKRRRFLERNDDSRKDDNES